MNKEIQFIHTADLHLGSPLNCGGEPPSRLSSLFNEGGYLAFEALVDRALEFDVDFVLIAGDVYDREARSVRAARFFAEQCERMAEKGIPVYIISGNHDPGGEKREPFSLPENVYVFSCDEVEEQEYTDREGRILARVVGQSYRRKFEKRKMYTYFTPEQDSFNIGLLHTQLDPQNNRYVPVSARELREKKDIDYWALGHIHQPRQVFTDKPYVLYPGIHQGRDINDEGVRGCFLVNVDSQNKVEPEFIPLSPVVFRQVTLDISDLEGGRPANISELEELLLAEAETVVEENPLNFQNSGKMDFLETDESLREERKVLYNDFQTQFRGYIVRWNVKGRGPVHEIIAKNREETVTGLIQNLNRQFAEREPFLWTHSLNFRTGRVLPDIETLRENNEVFREIDNLVEEVISGGDVEKDLLASWGEIWKGSPDHEEGEPDKFFPDDETKKEIILEARRRIVEELYRRGDQE